MVAPWRGLAIKSRESAAAIPPSAKESEGSRTEAALSPAGRCAQSAGESAVATAKQSRELAFAVGEAGANFASKFESEAAIINYQLSTITAEGIASCSSAVGEAGADIKELRERSGNYQLPWSARRVATTNRAEVYSNRAETKSNRVESDNFYAIKIFVCAILSFFSDSFDSI